MAINENEDITKLFELFDSVLDSVVPLVEQRIQINIPVKTLDLGLNLLLVKANISEDKQFFLRYEVEIESKTLSEKNKPYTSYFSKMTTLPSYEICKEILQPCVFTNMCTLAFFTYLKVNNQLSQNEIEVLNHYPKTIDLDSNDHSHMILNSWTELYKEIHGQLPSNRGLHLIVNDLNELLHILGSEIIKQLDKVKPEELQNFPDIANFIQPDTKLKS